ncbi:protein-glucosylgalactosylhydroxylysine glucosidase-like [Lytechinus variegatus]|uniref:protein-glucosylgalactosylhydroxylysine glucosidase-like n=1 Tax=Lytechinus variegatus TaxID=7654 RepID=UPI001BB19B62|nr:protein-glucosylgalactosylhydroxylysine glucosidase-like [Lytechinus variegatus]
MARNMKGILHDVILLLSISLSLWSLSIGCLCNTYKDISPEPTIFESKVLPEDDCCKASIGNGYLATTVYTDTIYKNGLYNGRNGESDRARIPSTIAIKIQQSLPEIKNSYLLDVLNGTFFHLIETPQAYIEQRLYAHQVLTRLLVNEITIKRKFVSMEQPVFLTLSNNLGFKSEDIEFSIAPPSSDQGPWSSWGKTKISETTSSTTQPVFTFWTTIPDNITLPSNVYSKTWTFITSVSDNQDDAETMYIVGRGQAQKGELFKTHQEAWKKTWSKGRIHVTGNIKLSKAIYGSMYYILSSLPPVDYAANNPFLFYGLSPGGLATGGNQRDYRGHVFWDQETWMYPPMLILYPELAQAMIKSRTMHLQAAKEYAVQTGEKGARFPWEMAYTGFDVCPAPKPAEYEIHLNGDISFAVQQYLYATNDTNFLTNDKGYELVQELANYWAGRVTYDDYKEAYTILDVMPPDEDHAPVDNSVYTNAVAQIALRLPYYAASLLDQKLPDTWSKIADNMHIMYDQENDYHPEFEGYERGTIVKQADVILLGYPIMYEMDQSTRVNDLRYYETYTEHTGPAMTWGMFAVGWLELGDKQRAEDLFSESFLNIREPFKIWTETAQGTGAVNFITGMGGFLQAVLMGYGGLRLRQDGITMKITLPQDCLKLSFTGINYLGNSLDISGNSTAMTVELTERLEDAVDLDLKVSNYTFLRLSIGEPILVSGASIKIMPHRR